MNELSELEPDSDFNIPSLPEEKRLSGRYEQDTHGEDEDWYGNGGPDQDFLEENGGFWYERDNEYVSLHAINCLRKRYLYCCENGNDPAPFEGTSPRNLRGFEKTDCIIPGRHCPAVYLWSDVREYVSDLAQKRAVDNNTSREKELENLTQNDWMEGLRDAMVKVAPEYFEDLPMPAQISGGSVSVSDFLHTESADEDQQHIEEIEEEEQEQEREA